MESDARRLPPFAVTPVGCRQARLLAIVETAPYDYYQHALVAINYQEQLQTGTFGHAVHYLIEYKLDQSVFHPKYRNDDTGRSAYDPAILLKIILVAYSKGITSSSDEAARR